MTPCAEHRRDHKSFPGESSICAIVPLLRRLPKSVPPLKKIPWSVLGDLGPRTVTPTMQWLDEAAMTLASGLITVEEYQQWREAIVRTV